MYGRAVRGDEIPGSGVGARASEDHGLSARRTAVIEQMRAVTRSVQAVFADSAGQAGLSQSDFQALVRVVAADGLTGAAVRRILGVTSSSVSELADRLEQAGMIARTRRPSDRRVVVLRPTPRGRRAVERALAPVLTAMATVVGGLSDDELGVVSRFLDDVERALNEISTR
jgi:DNA-binding MarR family transcriptional regulator